MAVAITMVALLTVVPRLIRVDEEPFPDMRRQSTRRLAVAGPRYVMADPILRSIALANATTNCFLAYIPAIWLVYLAGSLGWSTGLIGLAGTAAETLGVRPDLAVGVGGRMLPCVVLGFSPLPGWSSAPNPEKDVVTVPRGTVDRIEKWSRDC